MVKFANQHKGKWVATRDGVVVADDHSFDHLMKKVKSIKGYQKLTYSLVPAHHIAG